MKNKVMKYFIFLLFCVCFMGCNVNSVSVDPSAYQEDKLEKKPCPKKCRDKDGNIMQCSC